MRRARTLREFDEVVTAPLHGFRDTDDYWTRASGEAVLGRIAVPTLLVNARNDPFLPAAALPRPDEVSLDVRCDFPGEGGHAAFVSGPFPGNLEWLPRRVTAFFEDVLAGGAMLGRQPHALHSVACHDAAEFIRLRSQAEKSADPLCTIVSLQACGWRPSIAPPSQYVFEESSHTPRQPLQVARKRTADECGVSAFAGKIATHVQGNLIWSWQGCRREKGIVAGIHQKSRDRDAAKDGPRARARPVVVVSRNPCKGAVTTSSNSRSVRARRIASPSKIPGKRSSLPSPFFFIVARNARV